MSRFATSAREKNHNALNIDRTYSWIKTGFPAMHRNATSSRLALGRALAWQAVSMLRAPRGLVRCWSIPLIGREIKQLWVGSVETLVDSNWLARAQHSGVFSNPGALRASTPRKFALFFFFAVRSKMSQRTLWFLGSLLTEKRYRQGEPACKKPFNWLNTTP